MSVLLNANDSAAGTPRISLLACSVFEREIALHASGAAHIAEVRFFEMGLHDRPDQLRATLQENLDAVDARTDIEAVVLAYGLCGRGTAGLRPLRHKLVIPRAHDCIPGRRLAVMGHHESVVLPIRDGTRNIAQAGTAFWFIQQHVASALSLPDEDPNLIIGSGGGGCRSAHGGDEGS